ncbi:MAG TPA: hypothetical protein VMW46_05850 [Candidatus Desulfaltia sp.]|nr:hypothetical protein [Candidatus Desulfaltia sp.]
MIQPLRREHQFRNWAVAASDPKVICMGFVCRRSKVSKFFFSFRE